ncbi:hypothetical protein SAMN04489860_0784 [Paraoerskovia marina]|uniref:Uncharacterized protein n=1 Tax=Paraoerskovia marina TaxID=545619 RepID=A0A1H1PEM8_9CELL|nr:hypothetical protein SAMN04489860_0784 [Paraoerskovia marina]
MSRERRCIQVDLVVDLKFIEQANEASQGSGSYSGAKS